MGITDALKRNVHDLNEQTIISHIAVYIRIIVDIKSNCPTNGFHKIMRITVVLEKNPHDVNEHTITSPQCQYRCLHENHYQH